MSHRPLIDLWPSLKAFSDAIGVSYNTGKHIRRRGMIPVWYWEDAVRDAVRLGFGEQVTYPSLAAAASKQKPKDLYTAPRQTEAA